VYEAEHAFAMDLADRAAEIAMGVFRGDVDVRLKADRTPVTQADTDVEAMVRARLAQAYPEDHVLGEEEGGDAGAEGRVWIVDPIDATANFARGIPVWATLIALRVDEDVVLGVVGAPALGERYDAVRGGGSRCNGVTIRVSAVDDVATASLFSAGVDTWLSPPRPGVIDTLARAHRTRGFGDFWGHMLVARGGGEAMVDPVVALWDFAALVPIVEEAGGRATTIEGAPLRHGGSMLSTNGLLHDELVRCFAG
jgi:histidinol-phosphatase